MFIVHLLMSISLYKFISLSWVIVWGNLSIFHFGYLNLLNIIIPIKDMILNISPIINILSKEISNDSLNPN